MRKKTQRRLILLLAVAVIGLAVVVVVGDDSGCPIGRENRNDPQYVVTAAIELIESRDIEGVLSYFTPPAASVMYDRLSRLYARCDSVDVYAVSTLITSDGEITCRVRAIYDMTLVVGTQSSIESYDKNIRLVRINDNWYINQAF